jgi:NAD(P)-dependent dehydrogenase (short-subunit alcohol dehydrogenase family)
MTTRRIALITGANKGIGLEIARQLAQAGIHVIVGSRNGDRGRAAVEALARQGLAVQFSRLDVTDAESIRVAALEIRREHRRLDILVNNAGIVTSAPFWELTEAQWGAVVDINLSGVWRVTRAAAPHLRRSPRGRIVHIASTGGVRAVPEFAHYVAAKHGVVGLTRAMAIELAPDGVTVNAILPGAVDSPMLAGLADELGLTPDDVHKRWLHDQLLMEVITPDEVTGALLWLLSDPARRVTGHCLAVDGGALAR